MYAWCVAREPLPDYLQASSVMAAVIAHTLSVTAKKHVMPPLA